MATNTKYDVMNMSMIDKKEVLYFGKKTRAVVTAGTTKNIDMVFADDILLTGAKFILTNSHPDDTIKIQIVHPTAGVLNEFIDWYAAELDKDLPYPAKIPANLTIRVVYQSVGTTDVTVRVNYSAHKVLS